MTTPSRRRVRPPPPHEAERWRQLERVRRCRGEFADAGLRADWLLRRQLGRPAALGTAGLLGWLWWGRRAPPRDRQHQSQSHGRFRTAEARRGGWRRLWRNLRSGLRLWLIYHSVRRKILD